MEDGIHAADFHRHVRGLAVEGDLHAGLAVLLRADHAALVEVRDVAFEFQLGHASDIGAAAVRHRRGDEELSILGGIADLH